MYEKTLTHYYYCKTVVKIFADTEKGRDYRC
jgi:hypothetical protein